MWLVDSPIHLCMNISNDFVILFRNDYYKTSVGIVSFKTVTDGFGRMYFVLLFYFF